MPRPRPLIRAANPTTETYEAIVKSTVRMEDGYYWLGEDDVGDLLSLVLERDRGTTELILDEFDKVIALRKAGQQRPSARPRRPTTP